MNALKLGIDVVLEAMRASRGIALGVWWNVALLVGSLAALPFDRRRILGLNPWIKPIKFEVSVILFLLTMGVMLWALRTVPDLSRSRIWLGWGFGVSMILENTVIALQSARGVRSHMNFDTPLDAGLFAAMGIFIVASSICAGWLLVVWLRTDAGLPAVVAWGIRLGLLMLLAASVEGLRMVMHAGHTVGAEDGGPGLALVNWSTGHGDMRVAHFFALHALQLFPLAGLVLAATRLRESAQMAALLVFVAAYGAAVWWMFAEAMRGVPLVKL